MNDTPPAQDAEETKQEPTAQFTPIRALIVDDVAANCRVLEGASGALRRG